MKLDEELQSMVRTYKRKNRYYEGSKLSEGEFKFALAAFVRRISATDTAKRMSGYFGRRISRQAISDINHMLFNRVVAFHKPNRPRYTAPRLQGNPRFHFIGKPYDKNALRILESLEDFQENISLKMDLFLPGFISYIEYSRENDNASNSIYVEYGGEDGEPTTIEMRLLDKRVCFWILSEFQFRRKGMTSVERWFLTQFAEFFEKLTYFYIIRKNLDISSLSNPVFKKFVFSRTEKLLYLLILSSVESWPLIRARDLYSWDDEVSQDDLFAIGESYQMTPEARAFSSQLISQYVQDGQMFYQIPGQNDK